MTQSPHRERTDFGADPAFVASQSSRHGVSTKGFNPGERDACSYCGDPSGEVEGFCVEHLESEINGQFGVGA